MPLNRSDTEHLLRRVGFGATAAETTHFAGRDLDDVLDEMFARAPAAPSQPASVTRSAWFDAMIGTTDWWIDRMAGASWLGSSTAPSPLIEKLALFWHSHFACGTPKVRDFRALWRQMAAFWADGLGDFEDLAQRVLLDGGMLVYFDNHLNVKSRPQENLARELMELHTMGVGNFTESDVIAMARTWTGHGVAEIQAPFDFRHHFDASKHDTGSVALFGLPARAWDPPSTINELIKGTKQQATARFITTKLWRYYVDDTPTEADIASLSSTFVSSGMAVESVLREIFTHPTFWAPETRFCMVRQPIEWIAFVLGRLGVSAASAKASWTSKFMGQQLFVPPNVSGWGTNEYWISTTGVWGKARMLRVLRNHPTVHAHFAGIENQSRSAAVDRILDTFSVTEPTPGTIARVGEWFDSIVASSPWAAYRDAVYIGGLLPEVQTG